MSSVMEQLAAQMGGDSTQQISRQLGADPAAVESAISGALPMLFGALAKNSSQQDGLSALGGAIDRDHDGSILDNLGSFLGSGSAAQSGGAAILGHLLGGRQNAVESSLSRTSGLDAATISKLMALLAPLVMGAIGKQRRQQRLDDNGLADLLNAEREQALQRQPQLGGLASMLDSDGDGDILDDVAKAGAGLLGQFLRQR